MWFTFGDFICRTPTHLQPELNIRVFEIVFPFGTEILGRFRTSENVDPRLPHDGAVQKWRQNYSVISSRLQILKFCIKKSLSLSFAKDSIVVIFSDVCNKVVLKGLVLRVDFFGLKRIEPCGEDRFSLKGRSDVTSYFRFFKFQSHICWTAQSWDLLRKLNCFLFFSFSRETEKVSNFYDIFTT